MISLKYPYKDASDYTDEELDKFPLEHRLIILSKNKFHRRISWINRQIIESVKPYWNYEPKISKLFTILFSDHEFSIRDLIVEIPRDLIYYIQKSKN